MTPPAAETAAEWRWVEYPMCIRVGSGGGGGCECGAAADIRSPPHIASKDEVAAAAAAAADAWCGRMYSDLSPASWCWWCWECEWCCPAPPAPPTPPPWWAWSIASDIGLPSLTSTGTETRRGEFWNGRQTKNYMRPSFFIVCLPATQH